MLAGRYEKIRELGKGGFGVTFKAKDHKRPGKPLCVVKELQSHQADPRILKLFEQEAEVLERLSKHPQIPQLLAYFDEERKPYLVQEFIDGHDLGQEIVPRKRQSKSYVTKLLQDVLEVLVFVHQQSVIHRDLKPENLIRRKSDSKIVLIDFGAVKEISSAIINPQGGVPTKIAIGTPGYMPPEQSSLKPCYASDIYAVGMIAIYALTGTPPDKLKDDPNTGEIIWQTTGVSKPLAELLTKMVRRDHSLRYTSAVEALQAVINIVQPPRPPSLTYKELCDQARAKNEKGDLQGAISDYTQAVQLKSDFVTYYYRGLAYSAIGDKKAAIADYNQAIQLKPDFAYAYYERARLRRDGDDKPGALVDFQQAANLYQQQGDTAMYQAAVDRIAKLKNSEIGERVIGYLIVIGLVGIGVVGGFFLFKSCTPKSPSTPEPIDTTTSPPVSTLTLESPFCSPRPSPRPSPSKSPLDWFYAFNQLDSEFYFYEACTKAYKGENKGATEDYTTAIRLNSGWGDYDLPTAYYNRGIAYANRIFINFYKQEAIADFQKAADLYKQKVDIANYLKAEKALDEIKKLENK
ncbi:MAG: protein kinase [Nostoc sp.]|uniref:protein kinase domain-containing protein n=1 Tax=Nostoc sp. TaxID=1180 RepID=UPI002FF56059